MPNNLFALVGDRASTDVFRVQLTHEVQNQLAGLFVAYEAAFRDGVDEEVSFTHDWKADDDEILTIPTNEQVNTICAAVGGGALAMQAIDPEEFNSQGIRALIFSPTDNASRLLVQYFSSTQQLSRKAFSLVFDGDTFTRLSNPAFSIGSRVDAIIEGGLVKFKNFNFVKRVFDLLDSYVEASDSQIEDFAALECVHIDDIEAFKEITNQTTRKLISAVSSSGILSVVDVETINSSAQGIGLNVVFDNGKIIFPHDKAQLKILLRFLDHGVYQAPLINQRFMANSKRAI
ncbi:Kiwa anti-phage protein KwaB-like domain-containing protein [Novosphingobium mathurense]|uniref:DUF4868 domain-containing protein n=1 Tax=Novosphingobium mathurense TaxID=428990 RepID=A0A1U6GRU8_9SPHN|nr:Kiwa anti-phage protein KwaB-like domain-containing protein [Novosphingobium mathurense]SLJ86252.1 protein of unknown function [Novosphingobium mathurense]